MSLIHLNDEPGFQWAACSNPAGGFGKVCINHESVWVEIVEDLGDGKFKAIMANNPVMPENHRLEYGMALTFTIGESEEHKAYMEKHDRDKARRQTQPEAEA